jgi:hypothetical protein
MCILYSKELLRSNCVTFNDVTSSQDKQHFRLHLTDSFTKFHEPSGIRTLDPNLVTEEPMRAATLLLRVLGERPHSTVHVHYCPGSQPTVTQLLIQTSSGTPWEKDQDAICTGQQKNPS